MSLHLEKWMYSVRRTFGRVKYRRLLRNIRIYVCVYRVIQEESALLWEMIVWAILSKKVQKNVGPILNGYGVTGIF